MDLKKIAVFKSVQHPRAETRGKPIGKSMNPAIGAIEAPPAVLESAKVHRARHTTKPPTAAKKWNDMGEPHGRHERDQLVC